MCKRMHRAFDKYAPTVRPFGGGYQIVTGHHRHEAAIRAGLDDIPCWVKEMSDEEAYMRLVTDNAQGELSPLEIGLHALGNVTLEAGGAGKSGGLREYARQAGKDAGYVSRLKEAANVYKTVDPGQQFFDKAKHLYEVSRAPETTWPQLCESIEAGALTTVDDVSKAVARVKAIDAARPEWWSASLPDLIALVLNEPATAKRMENGLKEAKRVCCWNCIRCSVKMACFGFEARVCPCVCPCVSCVRGGGRGIACVECREKGVALITAPGQFERERV